MLNSITHKSMLSITFLLLLSGVASQIFAQDSTEVAQPAAKKKLYAKNTFAGNFIIDNQTVMVPIKGSLEADINHRFGTMDHGYEDFFGIFAGANIRLGTSYVPIENLQVGIGINNFNLQVDLNAKYAIMKQARDKGFPVSITYFGNVAIDTRAENSSIPIVTFSDRLSYFNEILIARKFCSYFSGQVGFSYTHFNNVEGYYDEQGNIKPTLNNDHFAFSASGKFQITPKTAILVNYDQPLTQHPMNNPHPNLSLGFEFQTSGHAFQIFAGNYGYTIPQDNALYNQNDYTKGQFLIGFNISRLWNF